MDSRIKETIGHIKHAGTQPLPVSDLAAFCNVSVSYFGHLFRRETGISPASYMRTMRMLMVQELLRTADLGVADILKKAGFNDRRHALRSFKAAIGVTPSEFRAGRLKGSAGSS